jgi:hypothetical protein
MIGAEAISLQLPPTHRLVLVGARYSRSPAPLRGSYCGSFLAAKIDAEISSRPFRLRPVLRPSSYTIRLTVNLEGIMANLAERASAASCGTARSAVARTEVGSSNFGH